MAADKQSYHKGNVRESLIEAAEKVLQAEGLQALSLRRLAREVGVAPSAIYNHFKNREALLGAIAADGFNQLTALEVNRYTGTEKSADVIMQIGRDYLRFAAANPELYRLMFSPDVVSFRTDPEVEAAGDTSFGASVDWWYGEGVFDPGESAMSYPYALASWAIMHGLAMQMIDGLVTLDRNDPRAVEALADAALGVFMAGAGEGLPKTT